MAGSRATPASSSAPEGGSSSRAASIRGPVAVAVSPSARKAARERGPPGARQVLLRRRPQALLKGVSYGPFAPDAHGFPFPADDRLARDLGLMAELGANTLRTFTRAAALAARPRRGPRAPAAGRHPVGRSTSASSTARTLRGGDPRHVRGCGGRAWARPSGAVGAYLVGNEIPPDIVRWYGARARRATSCARCGDVVKRQAPGHAGQLRQLPARPSTSTRRLPRLRLVQRLPAPRGRVPPLPRRLQNIAEDKPLVLTEFGDRLDPRGRGAAGGDAVAGRSATALRVGRRRLLRLLVDRRLVHRRPADRDWAFGLVDAERRPKPAFHAVQRAVRGAAAAAARRVSAGLGRRLRLQRRAHDGRLPRVAAHAATTRTTRSSSSTTARRTGPLEIAETATTGRSHAVHRHQENKGLSASPATSAPRRRPARSSPTPTPTAWPIPDWLDFLVYTLRAQRLRRRRRAELPAARGRAGGRGVAVSPGGPTHVLLNDEVAEHIPGCNMAFRREALEEIGGFEPIFAAAGDDVDLCWRLQNRGLPDRLQPGGDRLALPPQHGEGLPRSSRWATARPRRCSTSSIRTASTCSGSRAGSAASTAAHDSVLSRRPVIYFGAFGRGALPDAVRARRVAAPLPAVHARVERHRLAAPPRWRSCRGGCCWLARPARDLARLCRRGRAAGRASTRASTGCTGGSLIALLTYLGPLLRGLERYLWRLARPDGHRADPRRRPRRPGRAGVVAGARLHRCATGARRGTRRRRSSTG